MVGRISLGGLGGGGGVDQDGRYTCTSEGG